MLSLLKKQQGALDLLSEVRINPQISKNFKQASNGKLSRGLSKAPSVRLRSDLEFYIPQILSHYLREDLSAEELSEVRIFILKACSLSFFFAHRVWFYLKASLVNKDLESDSVDRILDLVSEIEVMASSSPEKLYLAGSE